MAMTAMVEPERRVVRELSAAEVAVAVEEAVAGKKDAEGEREGAKVLSVEPEALEEEGEEEGEEERAEDAADAEVDCMDTVADADADVDVDADSDAIEDEESAATELADADADADADAADRWETHGWSQHGSRCTGAYRDARRGPGEARNGVERVEWADGRGF